RRQGGCRPENVSKREHSPKSIVIGVADPIAQGEGGTEVHANASGLRCSRGSTASMQPSVGREQGRSIRFKCEPVGPAKPTRRERYEDWMMVLRGRESRAHGEAVSGS